MTATATAAPEIQLIDIDKLAQHPQNPRGKLSSKDPKVLELKASIAKLGQKVPCLVRPKGEGYELVLGHRRAFVQELLGTSLVPCVVEELSDELAIAIMLAEHATHDAPDPFLEGEAVATLLARPGWDLQSVSDHLGKSVRWCALRANLGNLDPKLRKLYESGKLTWPIEWLEDLARLAPEAQAELEAKDLDWIHTKDRLDQLLGDRFHVLGKAGWKLDDATLCPKAGACTTCPKTSLRAPGLFDDADAEPSDPKALKKAICRDATCWKAKAAAAVKAKIAELKEEHGKDTPVVRADHMVRPPEGVKAYEAYTMTPLKKTDPGARAAILLDRDGGVKVGYVQDRKQNAPAKTKAAKGKKPKKDAPLDDKAEALATSKREIGDRRDTWVEDELRDRVEKSKAPPLKVLQGLMNIYGSWWADHHGSANDDVKKLQALYSAGEAMSPKDLVLSLWSRVLEAMKEDSPSYDQLCWLADKLGIDKAVVEKEAIAAIPDPKWWPKDEPAGAATKKTPAHKAAALASPGMCRGCGCTHDRACEGGCSWVELPDVDGLQKKDRDGRFQPVGLCSSCDGAQPAGKKAKKKAKARA